MTKPLVERTKENLLNLIRERHLQIGDKLPNEYELAEALDVGRSTIREAVRGLATRNILEVRQGSGTYISAKKGIAEDPFGFSFVDDSSKLVRDLFELRSLLEPRVVERVAQYATEEEIEKLSNKVEEIEKAMYAGDSRHLDLDVEFHSMLATMSRNIAMDSLLPVVNQSIQIINAKYTSHQMKESSLDEHREIIKAIQQRDSIRAHDAMLAHVLNVSRTALKEKK